MPKNYLIDQKLPLFYRKDFELYCYKIYDEDYYHSNDRLVLKKVLFLLGSLIPGVGDPSTYKELVVNLNRRQSRMNEEDTQVMMIKKACLKIVSNLQFDEKLISLSEIDDMLWTEPEPLTEVKGKKSKKKSEKSSDDDDESDSNSDK